MAGSLCPDVYTEGTPVHGKLANVKLKSSKAYCEGRKAQIDGELKTTNHHTGLDAEDAMAWDSGWEDAFAATDRGCCAE